jgi:L-aspartate oxidase
MLEVLVFGKRIIERTNRGVTTEAPAKEEYHELRQQLDSWSDTRATSPPSLDDLQTLLWDNVGIVRNRESLTAAAETLAAWQKIMPSSSDRPSYEMSNLVLAGRLMTEAALLRAESRGAHFRSDFPSSSPEWQCHIVYTSG